MSASNTVKTAGSQQQNLAVSIGTNTLWGVVAKLAQVSTRLVMIPIVISHLGLGGYGIWSIIMTAAAYMRFGSIGIKSAFQKYVAEATGNGDYETTNKLLSTGCAIMLALSTAGLIPVSIFSTHLARAAGVPANFLDESAGAISLLAVIMLLSNVGAVFEAIVMGGHRIDLTRNVATVCTVLEAVAIIALLRVGYGLFAMAVVMAASEMGFVICCYVASKRIVPQAQVATRFITKSVVRELIRFAGSYQLVNLLEVVYGSIVPIALLRSFGPETSGVYAIATRLVGTAMTLPDAFLVPILSGAAMVYASRSAEDMQATIVKAFKVTLGLSLLPLGFISLFGDAMVFAWTGQANVSYRGALAITSVTAIFYSLSLLQLVLYRTTGKALMDNIRQVLRIVALLPIALFSPKLGFYGVLSGLAAVEFVGMLFMLYAIMDAFVMFRLKSLVSDTLKVFAATAAILVVGVMAARLPLPMVSEPRFSAISQLVIVCLACLLATGPAVWITKLVTVGEWKVLVSVFVPRQFRL